MTEQPRLVALREHRKRSVIPTIVGSLNIAVALLLMLFAALAGVYFALFTLMLPQIQKTFQENIKRSEERIVQLEDQYQKSTIESEKKNLEKQIENERKSIEIQQQYQPPQGFSDEMDQSYGFIPFTSVSLILLLVFGSLLLIASVGIIFRFRRGRFLFLGICMMILLWLLIVPGAYLLTYNHIVAEAISGFGNIAQTQGATNTEIADMMYEIQRRNLILVEVLGSIFGIAYFVSMFYLMLRPEVKEDFRKKTSRDLMDWENLPEGGKNIGGLE